LNTSSAHSAIPPDSSELDGSTCADSMPGTKTPTPGRVTLLARGLLDRLPGGSFTRSVALLAGGTGAAQALVVLSTPILTRIYQPEDFGALSVFASIVSVVAVIAAFRYELAIVLPEDEVTAANVLSLSVLLLIATTVISGVMFWLIGDWILIKLNAQVLKPYLWLFPLCLFARVLYQILSYWPVRKKEFSLLGISKASQGLFQVVTQIGLGLVNLAVLGLLVGDLAGRASGIGMLTSRSWRKSLPAFRDVTLVGVWRAAVRYRRYPLVSSWAALLNNANLVLPRMIFAALYGLQVAGWFELAHRLLGLPLSLIGQSVAKVYFAECARINQQEPQKLLSLFWTTLRIQAFVGLAALAIVALPAPWVFGLLLGPQWVEAGWYVLALSLMFLFQFIATPLAFTLEVLERQDLHLAREVMRIVLLSIAAAAAILFNTEVITTILFLSLASCVTYTVGIAAAWHAITRRLSRIGLD